MLRWDVLADDFPPDIDSVLPVISLVAAVCSSSDDVGEEFCCRSFWASSYETTCVNGCGGGGCGGFPPRVPFDPAAWRLNRLSPLLYPWPVTSLSELIPLLLVNRLCWGGLPPVSSTDRLASIPTSIPRVRAATAESDPTPPAEDL